MRFTPQTPLDDYARKGDFYPDKDRMLEAVMFLMNECPGITQYQIVKAIFLADREHLNNFGRPVTFDNYVAMQKGPVPSAILNLLDPKKARDFLDIYGCSSPWSIRSRWTKEGAANEYYPDRQADPDVLSETDKDCLVSGYATVRRLSPKELEDLLHDDAAYKEAWDRRNGKGSIPMKAELLIQGENGKEIVENLSYLSQP